MYVTQLQTDLPPTGT